VIKELEDIEALEKYFKSIHKAPIEAMKIAEGFIGKILAILLVEEKASLEIIFKLTENIFNSRTKMLENVEKIRLERKK